MSRIRANKITNQAADGAPTVENGLIISGVTTVTTLDLNGDLDVDGHLNADNVSIAGIVTATSFVGDGSALTGITQTTINNQQDNYVVTATGTANTLRGEPALTFDGATLDIDGGTTDTPLILDTSNASGSHLRFRKDGSNKHFLGSGGGFGLGDVDDLSLRTVDNIIFGVGTSEKLKIDSTGRITQNGTTSADTASALTLKNGESGNDHTILELISDPNQYSMIYLGASDDRYKGQIRYKDNDHFMQFYTNGSEKVRITSDGKIGINETSPDGMLHLKGGVPAIFLEDTDGTHGQAIIEQSGDELKIRQDAGNASSGTGSNIKFEIDSAEKLRITSAGKVGINSTSPQQALDVKGSINGGSVNQPFLRFHDSHGDQRSTKHYFKCVKGSTTIFDILTVDLNTNFHQALIILYYGARIQAVADATTYPVHKIIGVNRFNGGSIQFDKQVIQQASNPQTHADIDAVATSSTNYRIRLTYSGTAGGSSFCCGSVEIIGVGSGTDGTFYSLAHAHGLVA